MVFLFEVNPGRGEPALLFRPGLWLVSRNLVGCDQKYQYKIILRAAFRVFLYVCTHTCFPEAKWRASESSLLLGYIYFRISKICSNVKLHRAIFRTLIGRVCPRLKQQRHCTSLEASVRQMFLWRRLKIWNRKCSRVFLARTFWFRFLISPSFVLGRELFEQVGGRLKCKRDWRKETPTC